MMRVLMFGWEFPPHITGGLGTACRGIVHALSQLEVEVIFVLPKLYGGEEHEGGTASMVAADSVRVNNNTIKDCMTAGLQTDDVRWVEVDSCLVPYQTEEEYYRTIGSQPATSCLRVDGGGVTYGFEGGYGADLYSEVYRYSMVAGQVAKDYDFDVIHCHDWLTYPAGIEAQRVSGKPLLVHVHATEYDRSGADNVNPRVYAIEKHGMDMADGIVCVSQWTKNILVEKYNQNPQKISVVHNGIDNVFVSKPTAPKVYPKQVTFLGRITHQKGPEYFVEAAAKVLQKDGNVHFVIAGSGDMLHGIIERVARMGLSSRFHFTGFLKGAVVERLLKISDVYVMPSVSEPFGISALEAVGCHVPVVISRQSGVSEVVDNALKVDYWDTDAMADAIYALLNYTSLKRSILKGSKEELKHLSWISAADKLKNLYRQIIVNGSN